MQHSNEVVEEWRTIEEFDSTYDAQAKLGISNSNICACLKGRRMYLTYIKDYKTQINSNR